MVWHIYNLKNLELFAYLVDVSDSNWLSFDLHILQITAILSLKSIEGKDVLFQFFLRHAEEAKDRVSFIVLLLVLLDTCFFFEGMYFETF